MKKLLLVLCLAVAVPLAPIGCKTPPSERVVQVQTLKILGASARQTVEVAAKLYRDKKITAEKALAINDAFDRKWQPAFALAVAAAGSNLDSLASPDIQKIFNEFSALAISLEN